MNFYIEIIPYFQIAFKIHERNIYIYAYLKNASKWNSIYIEVISMNNSMIRKATPDDLSNICQILSENNRGDQNDASRLLNEKGLDENPELFIFECDNKVAGFITYQQLDDFVIQIDWLLKNEFKHRNLGTYLTRIMSVEVLGRGFDCQMSFPTSDPVKLSIVRKLGFTRAEGSLRKLVYIKRCVR